MFYIRMADLVIAINNHYEYVEKMCRDYIVDSGTFEEADIDIHVEVTEEAVAAEQPNAGIQVSAGYCEAVCIYRAISGKLIAYNAFLVHGACISYGGEAILFLAKSGTGKSTHICLWKKIYGDAVSIINGDKPIVRLHNGRFYAYGTPWCGKEGWNINTSAPLRALCFIERGIDNMIEEAPGRAVMGRLCHQILMPKDKTELIRYLEMMDRLIRTTDAYIMHCNMQDEAARVACEGMT